MRHWQSFTAVFMVALLGCGVRPAIDPSAATPISEGYPQTVTDSAGEKLTLHSRPARIVSTAPSNTEILFALGAGPQVVGVTTFCNFPPEAAECDKVGGFSPRTISQERIIGLKPDLVLTTGRIQIPLTESLRKLGLNVLSYDADTLEAVIRNIRLLGQAVGRVEEAEALASACEQRQFRVRQRFERLPEASKPRLLLLVSEDPLMAAGPKTFAGQMLELAGGRNVLAEVEQEFPRVSEEEIVRRDPEVIVIWRRGHDESQKEWFRDRPAWKKIEAVRNGRILTIDDDLIARAGPRLFDGLERLAELLHPKSVMSEP